MPIDWSQYPVDWSMFDDWRAAYDTMSLQDQIEYHSMFYGRWPVVHQHGDDRPVVEFFHDLASEPISVLEIGGWTGDAAQHMLSRHSNIEEWHNQEICREAVAASIPKDNRYWAAVPQVWPWEMQWPGYNVLFLQHVVEHMKFDQFKALIAAVPNAKHVFIQSPLENEGLTWEGYPGCHILEVGWNEIDNAMAEAGFTLGKTWWDTMYSTAKENGRTRVYHRAV